jgi:hypothetical protein
MPEVAISDAALGLLRLVQLLHSQSSDRLYTSTELP